MNVLIRLDERLIHGQVAIKWTRHLSIERVVVGNDMAAGSEIIKRSLMMAAPNTCKVAIKTVDEAIGLLNDPRGEHLRMMGIVNSPKDLLECVRNVHQIELINIGNYGRVAMKKEGRERKAYGANLYLYDDEAEVLREVCRSGIKCVYQTTPDEIPENVEKLLG